MKDPNQMHFMQKLDISYPLKNLKSFNNFVLCATEEYARNNFMGINRKKTKVMVFNPCKSWNFIPEIVLDNQEIEMVEKMKLIDVMVKSNLSWTQNTELMTKNAYKRLCSLRRLNVMGTTVPNMKDVFMKWGSNPV